MPTTGSSNEQQLASASSDPIAGLGGKLVLDDEGCLRVKPSADYPDDTTPIWPADYGLDT
jgi:hypothetical protein